MHRVLYENATSTYNKFFAWLESHHKTMAGPMREIYLNDPREAAEEEIFTEIYAPIG